MRRIVIYLLFLLISTQLDAQLSGNNLFEFQLGNLPDVTPKDLTVHFNQLNLRYRYKWISVSARYEHFISQTDGSSYHSLSQYQLQFRKNGIDLKVGNFSEILGNGLLLRAYEIPGSVFEDAGYRVRYGFYRDIRGFSGKYQGKHVYVKALRGKVLTNELPPIIPIEDRRTDLVEAIESGFTIYGQTAGFVFMRSSTPYSQESYYSLLANGGFMSYFSYNVEFAHNVGNGITPFVRDDPNARYGLYSSLNFSYGSFGLSLEYKDFNRMFLGSGISDPPTLVKEHKYKVLNRATHVPKFSDESGIQVEGYYSFKNGSRLLVNYARAVNEFFTTYIFNEYFSEYTFYPGSSILTLFADYSSDEFSNEPARYSTGGVWELKLKNAWSSLMEIEYQYINREGFSPAKVYNYVLIAGLSHSPKTSFSLVVEMSDDPQLADMNPQRFWFGADFSYKIDMHNTLSVFAGQRRGGPACTSGICYEVLDFEGVELRFKSKF